MPTPSDPVDNLLDDVAEVDLLADDERVLVTDTRALVLRTMESTDARTMVIRRLISILDRVAPPLDGPRLLREADIPAALRDVEGHGFVVAVGGTLRVDTDEVS